MSGADITLTLPAPSRVATARSSEHSASLTDEEDSSGTGVHLSPTDGAGSQASSDQEYSDSAEDYEEESWEQIESRPSEPPPRSRTSEQHRRAESSRRRPAGRDRSHGRLAPIAHHSRRPQPSSTESVDSNEDILAGYGHDLPIRQQRPYHHWAAPAGGQNHQYAAGYPGPTYSQYPPTGAVSSGQQLIPLSSPSGQYTYSPYQQHPQANVHGYFGQPHPGVPGSAGAPMVPPGPGPYGPSDMMHHANPAAYYQYTSQPYQIAHAIPTSSPVYQHYQPVYTPPPAAPSNPTPPAAPTDNSKDESYAELKKMLLDHKAERDEKEALAKKAEQEKVAALEAAKARAEEIAKAAEAAAAAATTEAEKKAAEEQAKLKAEAEEAANKAKAEADEATAKLKEEKEAAVAAAAAAAAPPAPEEKKKPIKFKDAVGRKFSFPFHLCRTWEGMEDLIRQAFLHVDIIGPHVAEGHYDLIGPNNEIILPGVWETVIEPDWTITMHMWPMPEPKAEEPPPIEVPETPAPVPEKKPGKPKPPRPRNVGFSLFGSRRAPPKQTKAAAAKKPS